MSSGDDEGFSLVELLVVVVIIGVLAAIAIPAFLSQRQSSFDAAAVSDLRNVIATETGLLTSSGSFSESASEVAGAGWEASDGVTVCADVSDEGQNLALAAWHANGGQVYSWTSTTSITSAVAAPPPADCDEAIAPGAQEIS